MRFPVVLAVAVATSGGSLSVFGVDAPPPLPEEAVACTACHRPGPDAGSAPPHLDGQTRAYLVESIELLRDGGRATSVGGHVPPDWDARRVASVARAFEGMRLSRPAEPVDAALSARGRTVFRDRCETCHPSDGRESDSRGAGSAILAGQRIAYLSSQMRAYLSGERPYLVGMKRRAFTGEPMVLRGIAVEAPGDPLTSADADAIAHFLAGVPRKNGAASDKTAGRR